MWKHYIRTGIRQLRKNRGYTLVHLLGLCIAFAVAILLHLAASFEWSYDRFHQHSGSLYQFYYESYPGEGLQEDAGFPIPFAPAAREELSGMAAIARYADVGGAWVEVGDKSLNLTTRFVDPEFLEMFSFPLLTGQAESALDDPNSLVLTKAMATRLFGDSAALGRTVRMRFAGIQQDFIVRGIAEDVPEASTIQFDALAPFYQYAAHHPDKESWNAHNHSVFMQLAPGMSVEEFEAQTSAFFKQHFHELIQTLAREGGGKNAGGAYAQIKLLPIEEMHYSDLSVGRSNVERLYPYVLSGISLLLILIASSNFINLSLASAFRRHKEIGMRKTLGGSARQLTFQFWMEAFLICLLAFISGSIVSAIILPEFNALLGYHLSLSDLLESRHMIYLFLLLSGVSLLAGGYPAWRMGRAHALKALHGEMKFGQKPRLAHVLAVLQFSISMVMIMTALVASRQIQYMMDKPLGYNESSVISIPISGVRDPRQALEQMRHRSAQIPGVESLSATSVNMGLGNDGARSRWKIGFDYQNRTLRTDWIVVSYDYLKTLEVPLVSGRAFSRDFPSDSSAIIINEAMARSMGPDSPLGKQLPVMNDRMYTVIGVMKDFNTQTLHERIAPLTLSLDDSEDALSYIFVRVRPEDWKTAFEQVEKAWHELVPEVQAAPSFLEANVQRMYTREKRLSKILSTGSLLAIVIACLGLFSLTALLLQQRVKEVGVRKVLGASRVSLLSLLSARYMQLVLIAFLISAPLAWMLINSWMSGFAYRMPGAFLWIALSGLLVFFIAISTVLSLVLRAASARPVESLRAE